MLLKDFSDPRLEYQKIIDQNSRFYLTVIFGIYAIVTGAFFKLDAPDNLMLSAILGLFATLVSIIWEQKINALYIRLKAMERITLNNSKAFLQLTKIEDQVCDEFLEKKKVKPARPSIQLSDTTLPFLFRGISFAVFIISSISCIVQPVVTLIN